MKLIQFVFCFIFLFVTLIHASEPVPSADVLASQAVQESTGSGDPASSESDEPLPELPPGEEQELDSDNPGMPWLDMAIDEKLGASSARDLSRVIGLAQRARKEGLSGQNLIFCEVFLASEQLQRGLLMAEQLLSRSSSKLPPNWPLARTKILEDLEAAVKTIQDQPIAYVKIAQLHLLPDGNPERAMEALKKAEAGSMDNPPLFAEIIILQAIIEKDPAKREALIAKASEISPDPRLLMLHAMSQVDLKQYDGALATLNKILEKDPDNKQALLAACEILVGQQKFDEALKVLEILEQKEPELNVLIQKARLLAGLGRNDEAIELLNDLREKHSGSAEILAIRAAVNLEINEREKALKDVEAALRITPESISLLLLKIQVLAAMERFEEASNIVAELHKENPENKELTLLLAQLLSSQKQSKKALEYLQPLIDKNPDNIALLRFKGQLLLAINRHGEAVKTLEAVVQADPTDEVSINNLSWILSTSPIDMIRNGERALELAKKACELTEYKKAYILSTLAAAYAELGDFEKALEWSKKSIELSAEDDNVKDRVEELNKELESYKKKQPYRELLGEDEAQ